MTGRAGQPQAEQSKFEHKRRKNSFCSLLVTMGDNTSIWVRLESQMFVQHLKDDEQLGKKLQMEEVLIFKYSVFLGHAFGKCDGAG